MTRFHCDNCGAPSGVVRWEEPSLLLEPPESWPNTLPWGPPPEQVSATELCLRCGHRKETIR